MDLKRKQPGTEGVGGPREAAAPALPGLPALTGAAAPQPHRNRPAAPAPGSGSPGAAGPGGETNRRGPLPPAFVRDRRAAAARRAAERGTGAGSASPLGVPVFRR